MTSLFQISASTRLKASPGVRGVPAAFLLEPTGVVPLLESRDARCKYDGMMMVLRKCEQFVTVEFKLL